MTSTKTRNRIVLCPYQVALARAGRKFAQSPIDERHLLRVLFEEEGERLVIITVYVAAREPAVYYDQNKLPMCLEIEKASLSWELCGASYFINSFPAAKGSGSR